MIFFEAPINSLSIGNVSYNLLKELDKKKELEGFLPISNFDFSAFRETEDKYQKYKEDILKKTHLPLPTLKCWHIQGSEKKFTPDQYLYTFYEVDSPTEEEVSIVKSHKQVFFSSSESAQAFINAGCDNVKYIPLGFDKELLLSDEEKEWVRKPDKLHFSLIGKLEKRKNTLKIIKLWLDLYGNKPDYHLTCLVNNPFFKPNDYQRIIDNVLGGKQYNNISFLPRLKTNVEVSLLHHAVDIDLSGLSNGEGWNLPAFNSACLGATTVVSNCSSHIDWADEANSILVEPEGKQPCYDGVFFHEGQPFNQGSYYKISDDAIVDGIERAIEKFTPERVENSLIEKFTYEKTVKEILSCLKN